MRIFLSVLTIVATLTALSLVPSARADHHYYNGFSQHGYTFRNGYFWYPGYSNGYRYTPPYYSYGHYYPGTYTAVETAVYQAPSAPAAAPVYSKDWKTQMVQYAESLDDMALFDKTITALSAKSLFGARSSYSAYNGFGANATTRYGYNEIEARVWGDNSNAVLSQAFGQSVNSLTTIAGQNVGALGQVVDASNKNVALVKAILAGGRADAERITAFHSSGGSVTSRQVMPYAPNGGSAQGSVAAALSQVINKKCASCHNPQNANGNVDMTSYATFNKDQKAVVLRTLVTSDPKEKPMPRVAGGGIGERLPREEVQLFIDAP